MSATDDLEQKIGNHLLRTAPWTKPGAIWIGLYTVMPNDAGAGGTEVSTTSTGYGRIQHGPGDASWAVNVGANTVFSNLGVVQFGAPIDNWGTIVGWGAFLTETGGTVQVYGSLTQNVIVQISDPAPAFAEGALTVTVA